MQLTRRKYGQISLGLARIGAGCKSSAGFCTSGVTVMKNFSLSVIGVAALLLAAPLTGANAADMAVKAPPAAPVSTYNWTGLYLGVQAGYDWGSSVQFFTNAGAGTTNRYNIRGGEGGGTLGYNWQIQQWVLGIETDFSDSHINGTTGTTATYGCGTVCATTVDDFGTLRGRASVTHGIMSCSTAPAAGLTAASSRI
jgi:opacity protein-like surface antigen